MDETCTEELARAEDDRRAARLSSFGVLQACVRRAADEHLPRRRRRPSPSWFTARQDELLPLIARRNATLHEYRIRPTLALRRARESARAALRSAVRDAKRVWLNERISSIATDCKQPGVYWTALGELKGGLDRSTRVAKMQLRRQDGSLGETDEDNVRELSSALDGVYNRSTSVDRTVLGLLPQLQVVDELADEPSAAEVAEHLKKAKRGKAPGENGLAVECFQALADDAETLAAVHACILDFWRSKTACFEEWRVGRLTLLPKKGDLSDPSNWRGIMLLDAMAKVVASIVESRLARLLAKVGVEYQNGFLRGRGCSDGIFSLKMALLKRKEHGLSTWALYVDLVKAFDSVDRALMLDILRRYGVPEHLVNLIHLLHTDVTVRFAVGKVEAEISSTVGVKQGDTLAPILFLFVIQAAMETLEPVFGEHGIKVPTFRTADDDVLTGRKTGEAGETFTFGKGLYADDAGLLFETRADLELGARLLKQHLTRFGLVMHCGKMSPDGAVAKKSKTEAVFYPQAGYTPTPNDTLPLQIDDAFGIVTFTQQFRYLGAISSSSLSDDDEIAQRLRSAAAAFGCLRKWVFGQSFGSRSLPLVSKGKLYSTLVLNLLLYGCENWVLTAPLRQRLNTFHNRCVRAMARPQRTSFSSTNDHPAPFVKRPALAPMYTALGLTSLDLVISNRKLRWAGHVRRMDWSRLPRKFLTSWVDAPRCRGRAHSYGHDLTRELQLIGFNTDRAAVQLGVSLSWGAAAQDREKWRKLAARLPLAPVPVETKPISEQARTERTQSEHAQPAPDPAATTWSQRLRSRG
jgi:hypothetical protein